MKNNLNMRNKLENGEKSVVAFMCALMSSSFLFINGAA